MIGAIVFSLALVLAAYALVRAIIVAIIGGNKHHGWLRKQLPLWEKKK